MSTPDFASFYIGVHGRPPFRWQERLARTVMEGGWPAAIDIPTGCGKTSVLDVAVYTLAAKADLPWGERPALRMFFIVDRRLVVDDVFGHARKITKRVTDGESEAVVWVRDRLLRFGGSLPLSVAQMRGGMYRSNTWADAPNQPLICVSTVDQVGSRLLFRGYGVSAGMRPVHAGLVGNDALYILDEAHLSNPFLETLVAVQRYQGTGWRGEATARGVRVVQMSATRRGPKSDGFRLAADDWESEALKPRLEARKVATLKETRTLAQSAADEALKLGTEGVFGVVLNTVQAARQTYELLKSKDESILLTGRVRPFDRDSLLALYQDRIKSGAVRIPGQRLFVVATQTVEVGADLDFDGLVTETAPLDSLRQRFGRLNRLGRLAECRAVILRDRRSAADWIYGDSLDQTWGWLTGLGDEIDFGVKAMSERLHGVDLTLMLPKASSAPVLFPAHLDAWAQTNPAPAVDPEVAPFLHGDDCNSADVQIVWRADLEEIEHPKFWVDQLREAPPVATEALPIPIGAARRWLRRHGAPVADLEGVEEAEGQPEGAVRTFLIWRGPDEYQAGGEDVRIRPGDTIVVRSSEGGCDEFGWYPESKDAVRDIGDVAANDRVSTAGGRYRIRVHPAVSTAPKEVLAEFARAYREDETLDDGVKSAIQGAANARLWGPVRSYAGDWFFVTSRWTKPADLCAPVQTDEEDEGDLSSFTDKVDLDAHIAGVAKMTRRFLNGCGVNGTVAPAVIAAAERHDIGKLDQRFQYLLSPARTENPLAKSERPPYRESRRRKQMAGYPDGARHEFASVALAESWGEWPEDVDRELALYLIGTHHGHGRPFPPVWDDDGYQIRGEWEGRSLSVRDVHRIARVGSGWAERYTAMTRQFGWWGLAYLETILRRADGMQSRKEEDDRA
jgi:CRISPR-associated endonuclease/helicase Cas3